MTTRRGAFIVTGRTRLILTLLLVLAGIVATWAGNLQGVWWITPLAGLVIGLALRGAWVIVGAAFLVGLLGWGLELAWLAISLPIGRAASVVAGIMGFGTGQGGVVIAVTLLLGVLLCLGGAWIGAALRRLLLPPRAAM